LHVANAHVVEITDTAMNRRGAHRRARPGRYADPKVGARALNSPREHRQVSKTCWSPKCTIFPRCFPLAI
jgi:hypothetical protein